MRVLLLNPPFENTLKIGIDSELMDMAGSFPPVGLLYIASELEKYDFMIKIIDCPAEKISHHKLADEIKKFNPDIVGITTFTTTMIDVLISAQNIKKINPKTVIVLGGHHIHSYPEISVNYNNIDYIIKGEGEYSFAQLCNAIKNNCSIEEIKKIKGIGFKEDNKIFLNNSPAHIKDIDSLKFPERKYVKTEKYFSVFDSKNPEISIISSRGCPFNCTFCFAPEKKYRSRTTENITDEIIKYVKEEKAKNFFFFDDLFSLNSQKIIEISRNIINLNLKIKWSFRGRINSITEEALKIAKKAGLTRIQFGIESFDENVLKACNKNIKKEDILNTIKLCKKYNIQTVGNFMIGLPLQTKEIFLNDIKIAIKCGLDFAEFNIFTPLPLTAAYYQALEEKKISHDFWKEFAIDPIANRHNFKMQYYTAHLSENEQFELCKIAFKKFYLRPKYLFLRLRTIRSFHQFYLHAISAIKLLKFNPRVRNV